MSNHPNHSSAAKSEAASTFPPTRLETCATDQEIDAAIAIDRAKSDAIRPWIAARNSASAAASTIVRRVADAEMRIQTLTAELDRARLDLADARNHAAVSLPPLQANAVRASRLFELAMSAIIDATTTSKKWRVARSGRIVSLNGEIDLGRTDYATEIELEKR
ncbi:MAG: hypothetical protein ABL901_19990 [Hyphomicrobiaceae bacterium]